MRVIDAGGRVVAPGFIDLHVHAFGITGPGADAVPIVAATGQFTSCRPAIPRAAYGCT